MKKYLNRIRTTDTGIIHIFGRTAEYFPVNRVANPLKDKYILVYIRV